MKPLTLTTLLVGVLFGAVLLPAAANADHGWRQRDGFWLFYNDVDDARQWYWFDRSPGRWMYWNDGRWTNYGPYRPPHVIIDDDAYNFLPRSYWRYPAFFPPPANVVRSLDPVRYGHYLHRGRGHDIGRGRGHIEQAVPNFYRGNPGRGNSGFGNPGRGNTGFGNPGRGGGKGRGPK